MEDLINIIHTYNPKNVYIGIGSAPIRDDCVSNRQTCPPYVVEMIKRSDIMIINIDIYKYIPDAILKLFPDLNKIEYNSLIDIYVMAPNIIFVFITDTFDLNINTSIQNNHINMLDMINRNIMDHNGFVFGAIYTGIDNIEYEKYFEKLYENTKYENKYNTLCHYGYLIDDNTCTVDVASYMPIFNSNNNSIIKIKGNLKELHSLYITNRNNNIFKKQFVKYIYNHFKRFNSRDVVIFRQHILNIPVIEFSQENIWSNINTFDIDMMCDTLCHELRLYFNIFKFIKTNNLYLLLDNINIMKTMDSNEIQKHIYKVTQDLNNLCRELRFIN